MNREDRVNETLERLERFVTDYERKLYELPEASAYQLPGMFEWPAVLGEDEAVEALIPCMRASAQEIVAALARRKIGLVRLP